MTKAEYQTRKKKLDKEIQDLRKEYLETNQPIPANSIVDVYIAHSEKTEKGMLIGYKINYSDDVEPMVKRLKKDGKVSVFKFYIGRHDIVTKSE